MTGKLDKSANLGDLDDKDAARATLGAASDTDLAEAVSARAALIEAVAGETSWRVSFADPSGFVGAYMTVEGISGKTWSVGEAGLATQDVSLLRDDTFDGLRYIGADGFYVDLYDPGMRATDDNSHSGIRLQFADGTYMELASVDQIPEIPETEAPIASDGRGLNAWRAAISRLRSTGSEIVRLMGYGDSWTQRLLISQAVANLLYAAFGQGADGWISLLATGAVLNDVDVQYTGWTKHDIDSEEESGAYSHDGLRLDAPGTTATLAITGVRGTELRFYYLDTAGTFRYRVDGGAWVTVAGGSTGAPAKVEVTGLSDSTLHSFEIDLTGNTGTVSLFGLWATGIPGVEFQKCGNAGAMAWHLRKIINDVTARFILADLAPDLAYVALGANDSPQSISVSAFRGYMETIVAELRDAGTDTGVVIYCQPETGDQVIPMSGYAATLIDYAQATDRVEYLDFTRLGLNHAQAASLGLWLDLRHLDDPGAYFLSGTLFTTHLQFP
ncbi:SGNH/GDSL hydrolase family protein [Pseudooceanicola sp. CBS1P-1]|uniref:SGNH hydrolase-type esterase domain-containing protein n=1 Tax=Pseudooceanicola albus TaxID=2692189 RepID=A0A6L7FZV8_9RHOB|nr:MULTISPECIES: SGNH/GDSL hydrolase family protein [Pseudooceanicola]MBT9382235.1 SGNH/GDSL hydrolase family protein [Pseudooceanicola endophyticus]MXN16778.1 hypothetical protein [Pseudooceanicola albus]